VTPDYFFLADDGAFPSYRQNAIELGYYVLGKEPEYANMCDGNMILDCQQ
jgi:hypothetical protein